MIDSTFRIRLKENSALKYRKIKGEKSNKRITETEIIGRGGNGKH
jgi:CRISPR/Cas system endoribonuclease Cas6 (RAMP superfamily)